MVPLSFSNRPLHGTWRNPPIETRERCVTAASSFTTIDDFLLANLHKCKWRLSRNSFPKSLVFFTKRTRFFFKNFNQTKLILTRKKEVNKNCAVGWSRWSVSHPRSSQKPADRECSNSSPIANYNTLIDNGPAEYAGTVKFPCVPVTLFI
jgi:hypothetical protein